MKPMSNPEYAEFIKEDLPPSPLWRDMFHAFWVGGAICTVGECLRHIYPLLGADRETTGALTSITLIFFSILLSGCGIYGKIARYAGAGTLVPITGFANSMASPAIEYKTEGYVTGLGAKMFTIAGPVLVYGTLSGILAGVIYYFLR